MKNGDCGVAIDAVAIDGPAASGKSSVGAEVARRLGFAFLDTGLMYRAATLAAMERGIASSDGAALGEMVENLDMELVGDRLFVNGADETDRLRTPEVDRAAPAVSAHPAVRRALVPRQRGVAESGAAVLVGRDICSVVLPDARVKVYLDASVEVRARRRAAQTGMRTFGADYERALAEIVRRDATDSHRADSPLKPAADAAIIDTDNMTADEAADAIIRLAADAAIIDTDNMTADEAADAIIRLAEGR